MKEMLTDGLFARPMYEERRWGWYCVLDYSKQDGRKIITKRLHIGVVKSFSCEYHHFRSETWTIISGKGLFLQDTIMKEVAQGDVLQIPIGSRYEPLAVTDLEFIEVQMGSELVEEDSV